MATSMPRAAMTFLSAPLHSIVRPVEPINTCMYGAVDSLCQLWNGTAVDDKLRSFDVGVLLWSWYCCIQGRALLQISSTMLSSSRTYRMQEARHCLTVLGLDLSAILAWRIIITLCIPVPRNECVSLSLCLCVSICERVAVATMSSLTTFTIH